jgi:hypothetical protein
MIAEAGRDQDCGVESVEDAMSRSDKLRNTGAWPSRLLARLRAAPAGVALVIMFAVWWILYCVWYRHNVWDLDAAQVGLRRDWYKVALIWLVGHLFFWKRIRERSPRPPTV